MEAHYFTILWWVLPYIHMNHPWVYMCSPSWTPHPPPSPSHPSGSSQCTSPEHPVPCIKPGLAIYFTYDNIHVSMLFSQIISTVAFSHRVQKSVLYICVSFAISHIGSLSHILWQLGKCYGFSHSLEHTVTQVVKNLPTMQETLISSLGWEDPLEKGMASHSTILACSIQWTEEPGWRQSMGSQGVRHDWVTNTLGWS